MWLLVIHFSKLSDTNTLIEPDINPISDISISVSVPESVRQERETEVKIDRQEADDCYRAPSLHKTLTM